MDRPTGSDADKECTMTINAFGGQGGYPIPIIPIPVTVTDDEVDARADEEQESTHAEVEEEAEVVARFDDPDVEAAIEDLKGGGA